MYINHLEKRYKTPLFHLSEANDATRKLVNFTELEYKLIGFVAFKYVHII